MSEPSSSEKVLIIFPSFITYTWGAEWKLNPPVSAPLGPLYVATAIQQKGYQVKFVDLTVEHYFSREVSQSDVVTSILLDSIAISPLAYRYPSPIWRDLVDPDKVALWGSLR